MNRPAARLGRFIAVSVAWLAASCDVPVEVIGASGVHQNSVREFPPMSGPQDIIWLLVPSKDFEGHIGEGGSLGLYASNCRSFDPGTYLGTRVGAGRLDAARRGYWLQFILIPSKENEIYSRDWSHKIECVYAKSQPDYSLTNFRSNYVHLNSAAAPLS